jgi:hypothetical protein
MDYNVKTDINHRCLTARESLPNIADLVPREQVIKNGSNVRSLCTKREREACDKEPAIQPKGTYPVSWAQVVDRPCLKHAITK